MKVQPQVAEHLQGKIPCLADSQIQGNAQYHPVVHIQALTEITAHSFFLSLKPYTFSLPQRLPANKDSSCITVKSEAIPPPNLSLVHTHMRLLFFQRNVYLPYHSPILPLVLESYSSCPVNDLLPSVICSSYISDFSLSAGSVSSHANIFYLIKRAVHKFLPRESSLAISSATPHPQPIQTAVGLLTKARITSPCSILYPGAQLVFHVLVNTGHG